MTHQMAIHILLCLKICSPMGLASYSSPAYPSIHPILGSGGLLLSSIALFEWPETYKLGVVLRACSNSFILC